MKKLALGRALERTIGGSIVFISSLAMFYAAYSIDGDLTHEKIFSALVIMLFLNAHTLHGSIAVSTLHELRIVFDRFASIFNFQNISM